MIIGVCGYKGAGKDTVGNYLVEQYGFTKLAFANKLKESVAALFDIPREAVDDFKTFGIPNVVIEWPDNPAKHYAQFTWREFLQRYGTESHRDVFGQDFWVEQLERQLEPSYVRPQTDYVITDVRFENEVSFIQKQLGFVVMVHRPGKESDGHVSERLPVANYHLRNDSDFFKLHKQIDEFMRIIKHESK